MVNHLVTPLAKNNWDWICTISDSTHIKTLGGAGVLYNYKYVASYLARLLEYVFEKQLLQKTLESVTNTNPTRIPKYIYIW